MGGESVVDSKQAPSTTPQRAPRRLRSRSISPGDRGHHVFAPPRKAPVERPEGRGVEVPHNDARLSGLSQPRFDHPTLLRSLCRCTPGRLPQRVAEVDVHDLHGLIEDAPLRRVQHGRLGTTERKRHAPDVACPAHRNPHACGVDCRIQMPVREHSGYGFCRCRREFLQSGDVDLAADEKLGERSSIGAASAEVGRQDSQRSWCGAVQRLSLVG